MLTKGPRIDAPSSRPKLLFISTLVALQLCAAGPQLSAAENDTGCDPAEPWGYDGYKGPLYWGTECTPKEVAHATPTPAPSQMPSALTNVTPTATATATPTEPDQSYAVCLDGIHQSPVSGASLNTQGTLAQAPIQPGDATGKVNNNGHAIEVGSLTPGGELKGNSTLVFNGTPYNLKQLHFHCPSEHRRSENASFDPMEMHLVHKSDTRRLAVVGVIITAGKKNDQLQTVIDNMKTGKEITLQVSGMLPPANSRSTWDYYGSLTTPPCTEDVKWFVLKQTITASTEQIKAFKDAYSNNSRGASFEKVAGGLKQISAGESGVWGVSFKNVVFSRAGMSPDNIRGTHWTNRWSGYYVAASGRHGVWLVSDKYVISFSESGAAPVPIPNPQANIRRVSAGKYGVWAIDTSGAVFYRVGVNDANPMGEKWEPFATGYNFKEIVSGEFGVWAVENLKNNLYFLQDSMTGTLDNPKGSMFWKVDSNISRVSSGFLGVWVLEAGSGTSQVVKSRSGITAENPTGTEWRVWDGRFNEITNGKDGVWVTAKSTNTSDPNPIYFLSSPPTE